MPDNSEGILTPQGRCRCGLRAPVRLVQAAREEDDMASLMEIVERVNKGELLAPEPLEVYEESSNSAEKFLAHHAHAMLDLRRAQQHMLQSLEAIDYSDQKVLNQFVAVSGFLGLTDLRTGPVVKFGACAIARREWALGLEALANAVAFDLQHGGA